MGIYKKLCKRIHPDIKEGKDKNLANILLKVVNNIKISNKTEKIKNECYINIYNRLI